MNVAVSFPTVPTPLTNWSKLEVFDVAPDRMKCAHCGNRILPIGADGDKQAVRVTLPDGRVYHVHVDCGFASGIMDKFWGDKWKK